MSHTPTTPDIPRLAALARAELPNALFVTISGSHLYGFESVDSDVDLRGCHLARLDQVLSLNPPGETVQRDRLPGAPDVELVSHEAAKYLRLMANHNGYILEQVFSPLVVTGEAFLARLRPLAARCVTRGCYHHYRGFFRGRLAALEKEDVVRAKTLLYAYRVAMTGVFLLETGTVESNLSVLAHRYGAEYIPGLIERKRAAETGPLPDLDVAWHRAELGRWEQKLNDAYAISAVPEEPPRDDLNRFLLDLRLGTTRG